MLELFVTLYVIGALGALALAPVIAFGMWRTLSRMPAPPPEPDRRGWPRHAAHALTRFRGGSIRKNLEFLNDEEIPAYPIDFNREDDYIAAVLDAAAQYRAAHSELMFLLPLLRRPRIERQKEPCAMKARYLCVLVVVHLLSSPASAEDVNCDGGVTVADVVAAIFCGGEASPCAHEGLPATGQQTCWNVSGVVIPCPGTGQDGDFQAGLPLSYTDNGDGTITDNATGLQWEKLDDNNAGGIHDRDNLYTWNNAVAVKIAALNTPPCLADHCDWRLPNLRELQSLLHYEVPGLAPSVSEAFNDNCSPGCTTFTCSCTRAEEHWTSTSYAYIPVNAWKVDFSHGQTSLASKTSSSLVRAVRGGLER